MASGLTTEDLRRLMDAGVINRKNTQKRRNPTYGTVSSVSPFRVILDGDTEALPYSPSRLFDGCSVGDRVYCVYVGNEILCTGVVNHFQPPFDTLRMNDDGQVELDWTKGGVRGRMMKKIWEGSWSSGSVTIPELPYYNMFLIKLSGMDTIVPAYRYMEGNAIRGLGGYAYEASDGSNAFGLYSVSLIAGKEDTSVSLSKAHSWSIYPGTYVTSANNGNRTIQYIKGVI